MTHSGAASILGLPPAAVATGIFALSYLVIVTERLNRSIIALLGASAMVITGILTQDEAIRGIDFNTIGLLTGMMVLISIARKSGMFEYLAVWSAQRGRAEPWIILVMLSLVTAVISAFLNNVTMVLLVAPVTLAIARQLEVPPYPFLFAEIFASNIGGTATLIGDPPNIMIGSAANLGFDDFIFHLAPVILLVMAVQLGATHLLWGRRMRATPEARGRVMALDPARMIADPPLLRASLGVIAAEILAFVFARALALEAATIAIAGAAVLMLVHNLEHHRESIKQTLKLSQSFAEVDWITIFFFLGLFVVVHGIEVTGVLDFLARQLIAATGQDLETTAGAVLWGSALLSAIVDNIPFVAAMIPLIKALAPALGGPAHILPLWWALSLGACLGGNGTLIGAAANLSVAGIAERNGVPFRFLDFTKYAFGLMLLSIAICHIYLRLRYF